MGLQSMPPTCWNRASGSPSHPRRSARRSSSGRNPAPPASPGTAPGCWPARASARPGTGSSAAGGWGSRRSGRPWGGGWAAHLFHGRRDRRGLSAGFGADAGGRQARRRAAQHSPGSAHAGGLRRPALHQQERLGRAGRRRGADPPHQAHEPACAHPDGAFRRSGAEQGVRPARLQPERQAGDRPRLPEGGRA
ncbi:unnamed protein product [Rotaria sp. Silwood1]|nr:unnamed protein product [Rotaria sp. Silwood1]